MNKDALLTLHDVSAGWNGRPIVEHVSLEVCVGQLLALEGANGSGKTTLVGVMLGRRRPLHGHVIRRPGLRVGYLPQVATADTAFPITVADVALMGAAGHLRPTADDRRRASELLTFAGLDHLARHPFGTLSGGQRQRALLCRALMCQPQLLILDEPATYMDTRAETDLYHLLPRLTGEMGIVLVTHDDVAARSLATQICTVDRARRTATEADNVLTAAPWKSC